jgi:hypothetical protein
MANVGGRPWVRTTSASGARARGEVPLRRRAPARPRVGLAGRVHQLALPTALAGERSAVGDDAAVHPRQHVAEHAWPAHHPASEALSITNR